MIHVSWYVSWYKKSIKYQVSWYIFGTVSVSVSLIHFRCISIINHWYMTVIHLLQFRTLYWQGLQLVDSSSWVSATVWVVSRIKDFSDSRHAVYRHIVSWRRFLWRHNTINWCSNKCCSQGMQITWATLTLNWKCWQDAVESSKFSLNSTQLYIVCTSWKTVPHGWTDESATPQPSEWLTRCLRNFCY